MSSFLILGLFALSAGKHVVTSRPAPNSDKTTSHILYGTSLKLTDQTLVPAELRVWALKSTPILPDDTVVFLLAKACSPADATAGTVLLDSLVMQAFPGDPDSESYDDHLPDGLVPWAIAIGRTLSQTRPLGDGVSKGFEITVSEYVRDEARQSGLQ
ncbi:hypothetical protein GLOTRDRAFT_48698 [Gloeophyllum trabeum ATCC 11539]|uniref:Uncharacterized protein n=1 Tax=Gloeophyllum trabeum (strain ATCC 11539 / FP-39264 / Madison 617) TaxID=670483 RepID=S7RGD7_GLOTA|nr:uncharacterized protein GLOTRDRAFT_48698 [Gloeophyllum trabeum ATCC 11539]EPQ51599.1 hypothetical protein GLOTRDRAFT_48698 [Gloeophyllum trabeum ATCC 11539]